MTQNAIGIVPSGPSAAEVLIPGFQGAKGEAGEGKGIYPVDTIAGLPPSPANDELAIVEDTTGLEGSPLVIGVPMGFTGGPAFWALLQYQTLAAKWVLLNYGAVNPDDRYLRIANGALNTDPRFNTSPSGNNGRVAVVRSGAWVAEEGPWPASPPPANTVMLFNGTSWVATDVSTLVANNGGVPPGTIAFHAWSVVPTGWLLANGAQVSRTAYAALFSIIGTYYGAGNGSTTFNIPDLRGSFLRAYHWGVGVSAGFAGFGGTYGGDTLAHTHASINGTYFVAFGPYPIYTTAPVTIGGAETRPIAASMNCIIKF